MHDPSDQNDIGSWLLSLRARFESAGPSLLPLFDVYAAEATFGRQYISADLMALPAGAKVLEIGAGSFLLSLQLVREGFSVTAVEPTGGGFSHFYEMRKIILEEAEARDLRLYVSYVPVEELDSEECFDFAYSINVMEHVEDVGKALRNVVRSLVVGGSYRFTCPNYLFPYEPHFNIPTLFSKALTQRVFGRKIFRGQRMADPVGTWKSLNWINVIEVRRILGRQPELSARFNRFMLVTTLERIAFDSVFAARRSPLIRRFILQLVRLRAHKLLGVLPVSLQPIIDCSIVREFDSGGPTWRR